MFVAVDLYFHIGFRISILSSTKPKLASGWKFLVLSINLGGLNGFGEHLE